MGSNFGRNTEDGVVLNKGRKLNVGLGGAKVRAGRGNEGKKPALVTAIFHSCREGGRTAGGGNVGRTGSWEKSDGARPRKSWPPGP